MHSLVPDCSLEGQNLDHISFSFEKKMLLEEIKTFYSIFKMYFFTAFTTFIM